MTSTEKRQDRDPHVAADNPADVPGDRPVWLDRLTVLVGEWEVTASFAAGFFGPGSAAVTSGGRTTFQWLDGRYFLIQRFVNEHPAFPSGIAVIGTSDEPDTFVQHYYDSRGVARSYQLTVEGRQLKLWRDAPGFFQRYIGVIAEDGTTISGAWEASDDGHEWRHDFDLTYSRSR